MGREQGRLAGVAGGGGPGTLGARGQCGGTNTRGRCGRQHKRAGRRRQHTRRAMLTVLARAKTLTAGDAQTLPNAFCLAGSLHAGGGAGLREGDG
jgi:hypothetical protein